MKHRGPNKKQSELESFLATKVNDVIVTITEDFTPCDHNMIMTHRELNNHVETSLYMNQNIFHDVNNNNNNNKNNNKSNNNNNNNNNNKLISLT